jgi:predicted metal-dependent hydrolase
VSHKSPKIAALIADCHNHPHYEAHYLGYFKCFNEQLYYEAHDVLEELWLERRKYIEAFFYQGLIQVAGAFVHLQKNRLAPASRLFALALNKLAPYPGTYRGLNLKQLRELCREHIDALKKGEFKVNPWSPKKAPRLSVS